MTKVATPDALAAIERTFDWFMSAPQPCLTTDDVLAVDKGGYITLPDDPDAVIFSIYGRIALEAGFHTLDHPYGDRVEEAYDLAFEVLDAAGVDLKYLKTLERQDAPFQYIRDYIEDRCRTTALLSD